MLRQFAASHQQVPPAALTPAVQVKDLRFAYRPGLEVLRLAELTVGRGERVFLHGPSGSGKTTLLGLLAGILKPQGGEIEVLGCDLCRLSSSARDRFRGERLGYVFQMFNLIPYLNVVENITLPCWLSARRRAKVTQSDQPVNLIEAAVIIAERLGIAALLTRPVTELSVGQQQRVAVARALLGAPELIIADEPTSALDSEHREGFLRLLFDETARSGAAVLFVSHDMALAPLFERSLSLRQLNQAASGQGAHV